MQKLFTILLGCAMLVGFSACKLVQASTQAGFKQGLSGNVFEQLGNAMPLRDKPISKGRPFATTIYIYAPLKIGDAIGLQGQMAKKINGRLIDSCKTDGTGQYRIALQPGQYSVLVQYEHAYFIPFFSGQEGLAFIEIKRNSFTALDIIVNAKASY